VVVRAEELEHLPYVQAGTDHPGAPRCAAEAEAGIETRLRRFLRELLDHGVARAAAAAGFVRDEQVGRLAETDRERLGALRFVGHGIALHSNGRSAIWEVPASPRFRRTQTMSCAGSCEISSTRRPASLSFSSWTMSAWASMPTTRSLSTTGSRRT